MSRFDPATLMAMASIMSLIVGLVLFFMRRRYPPHISGLGYWAVAPVVWLVASLLFQWRGVLPDFITIVVANTALLLGLSLYACGTRLFMEQPCGWRRWGGVGAASLLLFSVLVYTGAPYAARLVAFIVMISGIHLAHLRVLLRHGGSGFAVRLVESLLVMHLLILLTRLVAVATGHAGEHLLTPSLTQTLYLGANVLVVLLLAIGAVLMATERLTAELQQLATHDPLTQTLNRRAALDHCTAELQRSQRSGRGMALLLLDIDHFKQINDTRGHLHGDAVLRHFAERARSVLRRTDRLARYGGEEFLVLLPETDLQDALAVAERIHAALATGHPLDCQSSIGLTGWQGAHETLDAMLARADRALYQAKTEGRNRTCTA